MKTLEEIYIVVTGDQPDDDEINIARRLIEAVFAEIKPKERPLQGLPDILKAVQAGHNGCLNELDQNLATILGKK